MFERVKELEKKISQKEKRRVFVTKAGKQTGIFISCTDILSLLVWRCLTQIKDINEVCLELKI